MIAAVLCWLAFAALAMRINSFRIPDGRPWYWPSYYPLFGWWLAIVGGPLTAFVWAFVP